MMTAVDNNKVRVTKDIVVISGLHDDSAEAIVVVVEIV